MYIKREEEYPTSLSLSLSHHLQRCLPSLRTLSISIRNDARRCMHVLDHKRGTTRRSFLIIVVISAGNRNHHRSDVTRSFSSGFTNSVKVLCVLFTSFLHANCVCFPRTVVALLSIHMIYIISLFITPPSSLWYSIKSSSFILSIAPTHSILYDAIIYDRIWPTIKLFRILSAFCEDQREISTNDCMPLFFIYGETAF